MYIFIKHRESKFHLIAHKTIKTLPHPTGRSETLISYFFKLLTFLNLQSKVFIKLTSSKYTHITHRITFYALFFSYKNV